MNTSWTCPCCGKRFDTLPMSYVAEAPREWLALPEDERDSRAVLEVDLCIIDNAVFYQRGCVELPVVGSDEPFVWVGWVSLSEASFRRVLELWEVADRADEPSRFGWFETWFPCYPEPVEIKSRVHFRNDFQRPLIELEPTDYPLAVEQREGISLSRVKEIAAIMMQH